MKRRRYKRSDDHPTISLTADDDAILLHVFRHRLIDAAQLRQLFPLRSAQKLGRRLRELYDAGYIDRPPQQRERPRRPGGGSWPEVYALDREGAARVRAAHRPVTLNGWKQKNREVRGSSIEHALSTTRFLVDIESAIRTHGRVALVHGEQVPRKDLSAVGALPTSAQAIAAEITWNGHNSREGTAPDRVFGLHHPDNEPGQQHMYFFLEIDQGTETIEPAARKLRQRSFFRDSSLLRKFVVYTSAYRQKSYQERFNFKSFRVLTVTTSPDRTARMQATIRQHLVQDQLSAPPGLFLFTDWQSWAGRDARSVPCVDVNGRMIDLLNP